ncbi:MAG TPA: AraC family transcriptional regulator [Solimonas sp.]|nr:AraC family transcriptional regulator [Solimonas sp.]
MTGRASPNTLSVTYLRALFDYLQAHGLDPAQLLAGSGLSLDERDRRVTEREASDLFERAATLLGDPALGLHAGEHIRPGHYGVLGYVAMNCARLGEALEALRRYQSLVIDLGGVGMALQGEQLVLSWEKEAEEAYRQLAEFNFAGLVSFTRWLAGRDSAPLRLDFAYPAPADLSEHRRVYGCELRFDQPCYRLVLSRRGLEAPLAQADPEMRALMQRRADQLLQALPRGDDLLARTRGLIAQGLRQPPVELEAIAAQLALSPRSLQRKLAEQDLSFTQLVDTVRRDLALRHIEDRDLDLTDLAFLLGFSEQSAFTRAFKRWTGESPSAWRQRRAAAGAGTPEPPQRSR